MATLIIDTWSSHCSNCGSDSVDPTETHHFTSYQSYTQPQRAGCGELYTETSSNYTGLEDNIRAMRPDLPYTGHSWKES